MEFHHFVVMFVKNIIIKIITDIFEKKGNIEFITSKILYGVEFKE